MLLDLPAVPEGRYIIQWRALSTADGHTSQGTVSFGIGDPASATMPLVLPPPPPDPLALPSPFEAALRWLSISTLAMALGSLIFGMYVWRPGAWSQEETNETFEPTVRGVEEITAFVAAVASIGLLIMASIQAEANTILFIVNSRVGLILALRVVLLVALFIVLWRAVAYRSVLSLGIGAAALFAISLLSHSAVPQSPTSSVATSVRTALAVLFDWTHLLATAAWIGGLVPLTVALFILRRESPQARTHAVTILVARFTAVATASVLTLAVTGTYAAFQHIANISELWTTTYGRALSLKLGLFGMLLLLGGYNRWRIHPQLMALSKASAHTDHRDWLITRLRRSVGAEIVVGTLVLLAVGVLTEVTPAREAGRGHAFVDNARVGDVLLQLQVVPGDVAGDVFALDVKGLPAGVQPEVVLRSAMATHHAGNEELTLHEVEPGRWGARGSLLAITGEWDVEAIVRAVGMNDIRHIFTINTTTPETFVAAAPETPVWAFLLVAALLAMSLSQLPMETRWRFRLQTTSMLLVITTFLAATIPNYVAQAREPSNPLDETPEVLAAGRSIYQQNCVSCHGITGQGNGPAARSLPGLPGDFTQPHFATHTDGQVYGWIKGGKEGTAMPAFGEQLSDEQIWQVITHIRRLYRDAQQGDAASR
jgi:copper transport protein